MIKIEVSFPSFAEAAKFLAAQSNETIASATITPEKQQAARDSTAAGKTAKDKAEKPAAKNPETPVEALKQAVEEAKPARAYESSGIPQKIAKGAAKDKDATKALLVKFKAVDGEGKPTGKALKAEDFDAFEAELDALLAAESLG